MVHRVIIVPISSHDSVSGVGCRLRCIVLFCAELNKVCDCFYWKGTIKIK